MKNDYIDINLKDIFSLAAGTVIAVGTIGIVDDFLR